MLPFFPFDTSTIFSNKRSWIKLRKSKEIGRHSYDNQVKKKDNFIKAVLRWSLANLAGVKNECKISAKQKHAYLIMAGTQLHSLQEEESEDGEKFSNHLNQKWESWENCIEDFTSSSCVTLSSFFIYIAYKKYFFSLKYIFFQLECYWSTIVLHLTQIHVNTFMILWWISFHLWRTSAGLVEHHSLVWLLSQALLRYGMIKFAFVSKFNLRELAQSRKKTLNLH